MPFMDWRLVCFVFSLPEQSKVGGGYTKRVLREAMRGVMPERLRMRRGKIGFSAPLHFWFNEPLGGWLWEQVNERDFLESESWDGHAIRAFVEAKRRANAWVWGDGHALWPFLQAHVWRKVFRRRDRQTFMKATEG